MKEKMRFKKKKKSLEVCLLFSSWYNEKKSKTNHSTTKIEMQLTELIIAQCKLASVFNSNSWSDMFEAYGEPTVRYKSITSLTIRTIYLYHPCRMNPYIHVFKTFLQ